MEIVSVHLASDVLKESQNKANLWISTSVKYVDIKHSVKCFCNTQTAIEIHHEVKS